MKRNVLLVLFVISSVCLNAQSYIGYLTDNYSGIHGVINNPSSILNSRFTADINLVGASAFATNDFYGVNIFDAVKSDYDFDTDANRMLSDDNNVAFNVDILGPSFMFNLNDKSAIAVFTRARSFFNANKVNGAAFDLLDEDEVADQVINEDDFYATSNTWAEIGASYSRVLYNDKQHYLKGGLSLKYLKGIASGYSSGTDLLFNVQNQDVLGDNVSFVTGTGEVNYVTHEELEDEDELFDDLELTDASGFGVDIGFTYEFRPNNLDDYKWKLGLSINDIGNIKYNDGYEKQYDINLSAVDIEDIEDFEDFVDNSIGESERDLSYKVKLPTALHINADYNFNGKFYLNLNTDFSLVSKEDIAVNSIANVVSLTPRFESKWFSFYVPLSVVQYNGFQAGAGLRAGPVYLGSGSIISNMFGDDSQAADVYAGLKIPIYKGGDKDKDGDGVIDKIDKCPKEAGALENEGCPWGDKDKDGVLDNVDKCPDVAGIVSASGCPPAKPKYVAPIKEEELKRLQEFARAIYFNSGRSTFRPGVTGKLDLISGIMQEYPKAIFNIEGHTDSQGASGPNQALSDKRARAVLNYLTAKGVDSQRLSSIGYGEDYPIADNATRDGRSQNRRVEIRLRK